MSLLKRFPALRGMMRDEFFAVISPLLRESIVLGLDTQLHHYKYTRLKHSMNVAWRSYFLSRLLGWKNSGEVARAGLLHDLFLLRDDQGSGTLMRSHPRIAARNAGAITTLTPLEEDIILNHMFLVNFTVPAYKEGVLLILVDNICFLTEIACSLFSSRRVISADGIAIAFPKALPRASGQ